MKIYYTVYKITNNINQKYYIGKHQTKNLNDNYFGSGKLIRAAIKKYGIENFSKEILHIFDTEEEMNAKEKELVIISEQSYNLCDGGFGGFSYINRNRLGTQNFLGKKHTEKNKLKFKLNFLSKKNKILDKTNGMYGKHHTSATKLKMKFTHIGNKNSQYGTFWITNGIENKKSRGEIPEGYRKGRTKNSIMPN